MNSPLFPALRSFLSQSPSLAHWHSLCLLIDQSSNDPALDVAIGYLASHLEAWPPQMRPLPFGWREYLGRKHCPELSLVGEVDWAYCGNKELLSIARCPHWRSLRSLRFLLWEFDEGGWRELLESPLASQLTHLCLAQHNYDPHSSPSPQILKLLTKAESLHSLEDLELRGWRISMEERGWFSASTTLPHSIRESWGLS